jgi:hypothetical protein
MREVTVLAVLAVLALGASSCGGESARSASTPAMRVDIPPPPSATSSSPEKTTPGSAPATPMAAPETKPDPQFCGGSCRGSPGPELVAAIGKRAKKAHRCYDQGLAKDKTLRGRVTVKLVIGSDGRVCSAKADSEKSMEDVASCVAAFFRAAQGEQSLPAPDNGCADINAPLVFVPRPDDAGAP